MSIINDRQEKWDRQQSHPFPNLDRESTERNQVKLRKEKCQQRLRNKRKPLLPVLIEHLQAAEGSYDQSETSEIRAKISEFSTDSITNSADLINNYICNDIFRWACFNIDTTAPIRQESGLKLLCNILAEFDSIEVPPEEINLFCLLLPLISDKGIDKVIQFLSLACLGNMTKCKNYSQYLVASADPHAVLIPLLDVGIERITLLLPIFYAVLEIDVQIDEEIILRCAEYFFFYIVDINSSDIKSPERVDYENQIIMRSLAYSILGINFAINKMKGFRNLDGFINDYGLIEQIFRILGMSQSIFSNLHACCLTLLETLFSKYGVKSFQGSLDYSRKRLISDFCKSNTTEIIKLAMSCLCYYDFNDYNEYCVFTRDFFENIVKPRNFNLENSLEFGYLLQHIIISSGNYPEKFNELMRYPITIENSIIGLLVGMLKSKTIKCIAISLDLLEKILLNLECLNIFVSIQGIEAIERVYGSKNPFLPEIAKGFYEKFFGDSPTDSSQGFPMSSTPSIFTF